MITSQQQLLAWLIEPLKYICIFLHCHPKLLPRSPIGGLWDLVAEHARYSEECVFVAKIQIEERNLLHGSSSWQKKSKRGFGYTVRGCILGSIIDYKYDIHHHFSGS